MERICPKCNFFIDNEPNGHEWERTKNICTNCGAEVLNKLTMDDTITMDPSGEYPSNG